MQKYFLFLLLCLTQNILAQQYWSKNYDFFTGNDYAKQLVRTPKGVVVCPHSFCDNNSRECVGLIQLDLNGNILWKTVLYDSLEINHEESIVYWRDTIWLHADYVNDPLDRRTILAFDTNGNYAGRHDYTYLSKKGYNEAREIDALGNKMFITFDSRAPNANNSLTILRALDEHFNLLWEHTIPNVHQYAFWDNIQATPDGGVIAIEVSTQNWKNRSSIIKYDDVGNITWKTVFPYIFGYYSENVNINTHPDGGYIGLLQADSFVSVYADDYPTIVFKLDASGQFEWQKVDFYQFSDLFDIFSAKNGDLIISGLIQPPPPQDPYYAGYLRRMDVKGSTKWERRIFDKRDYGDIQYLFDGLELDNGDLMFTGPWFPDYPAHIPDSFPDNVWLLKVDSNGCFTPNCDTNQYIVPTQEAPARRQDGAFAAFPNPFGHTLTLASVIGQPLPPGDYQAAVYDALGQQVARRDINPELLSVFELEGLPPGAYTVVVFRDGAAVQTMTAMKQ